jgi:probable HAF family extracellular repeat protein
MSRSGCTTTNRLIRTVSLLLLLGALLSFALADIASGQQIVGSSTLSGDTTQHAFLWQNGTMTDLGTLGTSSTCHLNSLASGINASGQVAGSSGASDCTNNAFLWQNGMMTNLGHPGGVISNGLGINVSGQVVGWVGFPLTSDPAGAYAAHATVWQNGGATDLGTFGEQSSEATGINASGQIVGNIQLNADGTKRAFLWQNGAATMLGLLPGASATTAYGINASGQVVGCSSFQTPTATDHAFLWQSGVMTDLGTLGGTSSDASCAFAINDSGLIVGYSGPLTGPPHAVIWKNRVITDLGVAGMATGINSVGEIVGNGTHAFLWQNGVTTDLGTLGGTRSSATGISDPALLLDPVPDLLSGSAVSADPQLLATKGRGVQGVAADGVTQIVVRIPAANVGDQFTLTVFNDQQPSSQSSLPDEDGALGNPGDTSFLLSQITIAAKNTGTGPDGPNPTFAFAVYRAPKDFARPAGSGAYKLGSCGGSSATDDQSGCRSVSIHVQNQTGATISTIQVRILRPPVILVHGIWANSTSWRNFAPFNVRLSSDHRFFSGSVHYDGPVGITSSFPSYDPSLYPKVLANSIGFQYNAREVLSQIDELLQAFKSGQNPQAIPVASIQGDIVAHSMGGDITRTLALQPYFLSGLNLGQGNIHKVITIDTPHLGSQLATQLLSGQNNCTLAVFAVTLGEFSFSSVVVNTGYTFAGAIGDLQGDGNGGGMSAGLQDIANPALAQHPLRIAFVAGTTMPPNLSGVGTTVAGVLLRGLCLPSNDPLAVNLTSTGWPNVFSGQASDGVVPLNSQLNRVNGALTTTVPAASLFTSPGYIHTPSLGPLGFSGPTVLDAGAVPLQVVNLLNTPVTDPTFNPTNP